jgi:hypothetical protein
MIIKLNDTLSLDVALPKHLSKRQQFIVKHYSNPKNYGVNNIVAHLSSYANSFKGNSASLRDFKDYLKKDSGIDKLSEREPNYFLNKHLAVFNPDLDKSPSGIMNGNALGIEIECIISSRYTKRAIKDMVMQRKIKNCNVKDDGSIKVTGSEDGCTCHDDSSDCDEYPDDCTVGNGGEYGLEFTIITDINDMSNLVKLCDMLKDIGAYVNKSCGLHVHLDCRDISSRDRLASSYTQYGIDTKKMQVKRADRLVWALPLLTKMLPKSRLDNTYCKYGKSVDSNRYYMINTRALREHNTIEVRMHSGTTDFTKISNFAKIVYAISRAKGTRFDALPTISDKVSLYKAIDRVERKTGLSRDLRDYIASRSRQFNPSLFDEVASPTIVNEELSEELEQIVHEVPARELQTLEPCPF